MTSRQLLACTITEVFEYIVYTSLLAVCLMCIKNRYIILKPGTYNFLCVNNQIKKSQEKIVSSEVPDELHEMSELSCSKNGTIRTLTSTTFQWFC